MASCLYIKTSINDALTALIKLREASKAGDYDVT